MKKDNKGFSLVELIVVVLIMGILAVALTPQVMKWVNNSRISADNQTLQSLIGNAQIAMANEDAYAERAKGIQIIVNKSKAEVKKTAGSVDLTAEGSNGFLKKFYEVCGGKSEFEKLRTKQSGDDVEIEINIDTTNGGVSGTIKNGQASITDN